MQPAAFPDDIFNHLRETERTVRAGLLLGIEADIASIDRFIVRPFAAARSKGQEAIAALGSMDEEDLHASIRGETFDRIALDCTIAVYANVGVRARARFRTYAEALSDVERSLAAAIARAGSTRRAFPPPMFALERIESEGFALPGPPRDVGEIDGWLRLLRASLEAEIVARMRTACERTLARGLARLGTVKARALVALQGIDRGLSA